MREWILLAVFLPDMASNRLSMLSVNSEIAIGLRASSYCTGVFDLQTWDCCLARVESMLPAIYANVLGFMRRL